MADEAAGTNTGHGHVWARPDGVKARCGGPALCADCAMDDVMSRVGRPIEPCAARTEKQGGA